MDTCMILAIVNGNRLINVQECVLSLSWHHWQYTVASHCGGGTEIGLGATQPPLQLQKEPKKIRRAWETRDRTQEGLETEFKPLWKESYQSSRMCISSLKVCVPFLFISLTVPRSFIWLLDKRVSVRGEKRRACEWPLFPALPSLSHFSQPQNPPWGSART